MRRGGDDYILGDNKAVALSVQIRKDSASSDLKDAFTFTKHALESDLKNLLIFHFPNATMMTKRKIFLTW